MSKLFKPTQSFAILSNQLAQDSNLSFAARGIFAYMISLPDDWDFSAERIANESPKEGRKAILAELNNLLSAGYLARKKNKDGTVDYYMYGNPSENPHYMQEEQKPKSSMGTLATVPKQHGAEWAPIIKKHTPPTKKEIEEPEILENGKKEIFKTVKTLLTEFPYSLPMAKFNLTDDQIDGVIAEVMIKHPSMNATDVTAKVITFAPYSVINKQQVEAAAELAGQKIQTAAELAQQAADLSAERVKEFHAKKVENINKVGTSSGSFQNGNSSKYPAKGKVFKPYYREYSSRKDYEDAILDARDRGEVVEIEQLPGNAASFWGEEVRKDFTGEFIQGSFGEVGAILPDFKNEFGKPIFNKIDKEVTINDEVRNTAANDVRYKGLRVVDAVANLQSAAKMASSVFGP